MSVTAPENSVPWSSAAGVCTPSFPHAMLAEPARFRPGDNYWKLLMAAVSLS